MTERDSAGKRYDANVVTDYDPVPSPKPSTYTQPPGRTLTARGVSTRNRLVEAAWELFGQKPYGEVSVAEITARAGVATGSYYTYFTSKEEIFRVVAQRALEEMLNASSRDPGNAERDPVRDIAHASRQYFLACHRHRLIARSIESLRVGDEEIRLNRRNVLLRHVKRIERRIRRLQEDGTCDPKIDPWFTALALQSMVVNLAYDHLVHRDDFEDIEALVAAVTPIWARAVGLEAWL